MIFENNNRAIIKKIIKRSLKTNKKRNFFIIMAVMLTTLLIGSVFSIGMSLLESVRINQIRYAGSVADAAIGHPSAVQMNKLRKLDYVKTVGTDNSVGSLKTTPQMGKISLSLYYFDKTEWEKLRAPAYFDIKGKYPEKENEIMVSKAILQKFGIDNPYIGMTIPLSYYTDSNDKGDVIKENFRLSGWFTSYGFTQSMNKSDVILVSKALSEKHQKTVEKDGAATIIFKHRSRISKYTQALVSDLELTASQPVALTENADKGAMQTTTTLVVLSVIVLFLILIGYLLIHNVLYISVSRDVRFYGLLKTIGTTPNQIKRIVMGQILQLCMIGIPIGIILSIIISLRFVPLMISKLGAVSTDAVISFSPIIYLGAIIFPLITAILGASKPAKRTAKMSPIEAQRFTGRRETIQKTRTQTHGKPLKMAIRNIFRDKRQAGVVLLSLFLGVTTFVTVTTTVFSMNITKYIESVFESNFILENNAWPKSEFNQAFLNNLKSLPGFESIGIITWEKMSLEYSPDEFGEYIDNYPERSQIVKMQEKDIAQNFRGFVIGVDKKSLKNQNLQGNQIDIDAFERGEIALIATDKPELFKNVSELNIMPTSHSSDDRDSSFKFKIKLGGFVPFEFKSVGSGLAPTIIISNKLMKEWFSHPIVSQIELNVSDKYEANDLEVLKRLIRNEDEISLTSRLESTNELKNAKMVLFVLGGGMSLIIAFIGLLNFVNIMSVNIMVRKIELATLESLGMSRKQVTKLLICEGLVFAVIALGVALTVGNLVTYGIYRVLKSQISFMTFSYPFLPVISITVLVLLVCMITPLILNRSLYKSTIVERLREAM